MKKTCLLFASMFLSALCACSWMVPDGFSIAPESTLESVPLILPGGGEAPALSLSAFGEKANDLPQVPYQGEWIPSWTWRQRYADKEGYHGGIRFFQGDDVHLYDDGTPISADEMCKDYVWLMTHPINAAMVNDESWPTGYDMQIFQQFCDYGGQPSYTKVLGWQRLTGEPDSSEGAFLIRFDVQKIISFETDPSYEYYQPLFAQTGEQDWVLQITPPMYADFYFERIVSTNKYRFIQQAEEAFDASARRILNNFIHVLGWETFASPAALPPESLFIYASDFDGIYRPGTEISTEGGYTQEEVDELCFIYFGSNGLLLPDSEYYDPDTQTYDGLSFGGGSCVGTIVIAPFKAWWEGDMLHLIAQIDTPGIMREYVLQPYKEVWRVLSSAEVANGESWLSPIWGPDGPIL